MSAAFLTMIDVWATKAGLISGMISWNGAIQLLDMNDC